MPTTSTKQVRLCTHIKVTGVRCGSLALRGEQFCYFHQRMVRGVRTPPQARLHPIALIEDEAAIQASLMEVINALARNTIDLQRAALILRALHIAVRNARRVRFDSGMHPIVKEVPEYPAPPQPAKPTTPPLKPKAGLNGPPIGLECATTPDPTRRKPPSSIRQAPKERKNGARSISSG